MAASLEEVLISVWNQALFENATTVILESGICPVRRTSRSRLREVDFEFEGQRLRGRAEPEDKLPLGAACPGREEDHAVSD